MRKESKHNTKKTVKPQGKREKEKRNREELQKEPEDS